MMYCFKPRSLAVTVLLMMSIAAMAVPAKKQWIERATTEGTIVKVQLVGDEFGHWYVDAEGKTYTVTADDLLVTADAATLVARRSSRATKVNAARRSPARISGEPSTQGEYIGTKKGLVILVNFKDLSMAETNTQSAFDNQFNQVGYKKNGHIGSVHDYFFDQSYGQFDLTFDVVGPVTVSNDMSFYGDNDNDGRDKHPATMIGEAINLADPLVNYADYDWDGDGKVEQVFVVYAGYGESSGAASNTIWPHMWDLASAAYLNNDGPGALVFDGVRINTYACSCELDGTTGSTMDGIGTACHEFSHCLGLPDFYDRSDSNNFGMASWSLMDYGCYNGNGCVPCAYTAYERWYIGWMTPTTLSETTSVTGMKAITATEPSTYIIYNDANTNEYYILQNIQQESWNTYAYGHGLLVMHVNYVKSYWQDNTVNTSPTLQCCTIIPADNQFMTGFYNNQMHATPSDLAGDPFPGSTNKSELTDTSTPSAILYNNNPSGNKFMSKPITDIAEVNGLINFEFMKGGSESTTEGEWVLVNNEDMLESGIQLIIACNTENVTAGELSSDYLSACTGAVFLSDKSEITTVPGSSLVFTLGGSAGSWTLSDSSGRKLSTTEVRKLSLGGSNNVWKITIASNGNATIQYAENSTWGFMQYNVEHPRFNTYTSSQTPIQLYCKKVAVTDVVLNKSELSMWTGDDEKLIATIIPANATIKGLIWTTSDAGVATVDDGTVTAVSAGSAVITVTTVDGNFFASCSVTVTPCPAYTVTLGDTHTQLTESVGREGVTLPERIAEGYTFVGWSQENIIQETTTTPVIIPVGIYHPEADVTLYPVFSYTQSGGEAWQLVTDLSTVTEGEYALLSPNYYAFNGTISNGHGQHTTDAFVFNANGVASTAPSGTVVFTFAVAGNGFTLYNSVTNKYLYAKQAKSGNLDWHTSENSYWYWNATQENWIYDSNFAFLRTYNDTFRTYQGSSYNPLLMARKVDGESIIYTSLLSEHSGIIGDANDDGVVDVSDVTLVVSYVLGTLGEGSTFVFEQANVATSTDGGNETIDVSDITAIVAIIIGGTDIE